MKKGQVWWLYIIETDKGNLYTGITTDIDRRWQEHSAVARGVLGARGAKFFRSQSPLRLVYRQSFASRHEASSQEAAIKKMTRQQKACFIELSSSNNA